MQDKFLTVLLGMLGALIVLLAVECFTPSHQKIATVDITGLTQQFIEDSHAKNLSKDELKNETVIFGKTLEKTIKQFAYQHNLIIVPKEAVMAGGQDYTRDISILIDEERS